MLGGWLACTASLIALRSGPSKSLASSSEPSSSCQSLKLLSRNPALDWSCIVSGRDDNVLRRSCVVSTTKKSVCIMLFLMRPSSPLPPPPGIIWAGVGGFILGVVCLDDMFPHWSSVYRFQIAAVGATADFCTIASAIIGQAWGGRSCCFCTTGSLWDGIRCDGVK